MKRAGEEMEAGAGEPPVLRARLDRSSPDLSILAAKREADLEAERIRELERRAERSRTFRLHWANLKRHIDPFEPVVFPLIPLNLDRVVRPDDEPPHREHQLGKRAGAGRMGRDARRAQRPHAAFPSSLVPEHLGPDERRELLGHVPSSLSAVCSFSV